MYGATTLQIRDKFWIHQVFDHQVSRRVGRLLVLVPVLTYLDDDADGAPCSPLSAGRLGACVAYAKGVAGVQLSSHGVRHRCFV